MYLCFVPTNGLPPAARTRLASAALGGVILIGVPSASMPNTAQSGRRSRSPLKTSGIRAFIAFLVGCLACCPCVGRHPSPRSQSNNPASPLHPSIHSNAGDAGHWLEGALSDPHPPLIVSNYLPPKINEPPTRHHPPPPIQDKPRPDKPNQKSKRPRLQGHMLLARYWPPRLQPILRVGIGDQDTAWSRGAATRVPLQMAPGQ